MKPHYVILTTLLGVARVSGLPSLAAAEEQDPIVAQVVEMLEAKVSEELISRWLEMTARSPEDISAGEMIALSEAGASPELIGRLLDLVARQGEAVAADSAAEKATKPLAVLPDRLASPSGANGGSKSAHALFKVSYRQMMVDEASPDAPADKVWRLYAYLDGEPLTSAEPSAKGGGK